MTSTIAVVPDTSHPRRRMSSDWDSYGSSLCSPKVIEKIIYVYNIYIYTCVCVSNECSMMMRGWANTFHKSFLTSFGFIGTLYICIYIYIFVHVYIYTYIYMCVCVCVCMYDVCMYIYVQMCIHNHTYHTIIYIYIYICIHLYMYMYICVCNWETW